MNKFPIYNPLADDRPVEEERKSVRFDLEKEVNIKFTYSGSEDEWDTESEEQEIKISATITSKNSDSPAQRRTSLPLESNNLESAITDNEVEASNDSEQPKEKPIMILKQSKVVAKRFLVENVTENEHFYHMSKDKSSDTDGGGDHIPSKFENVRNIDLVSKSENESTTTLKSSESRSSLLDEIRKNKEIMLEAMKKCDIRAKNEMQKEKDDAYHLMKIRHDLESARSEREKTKVKSQSAKNFEAVKSSVRKEREKEIQDLKDDFQIRYEDTKTEFEAMFADEKGYLEENLKERLAELREKMSERESLEIRNLVAEMDKIRVEELSKLRNELETCYEKEKQEILENLKIELEQKKKELLEHRNQEIEKLKNEYKRSLEEEKVVKIAEIPLAKEHAEKVEAMKVKLEKEFEETVMELRMQQREKISKVTEDHEISLAEILRDFRTDVRFLYLIFFSCQLGEKLILCFCFFFAGRSRTKGIQTTPGGNSNFVFSRDRERDEEAKRKAGSPGFGRFRKNSLRKTARRGQVQYAQRKVPEIKKRRATCGRV